MCRHSPPTLLAPTRAMVSELWIEHSDRMSGIMKNPPARVNLILQENHNLCLHLLLVRTVRKALSVYAESNYAADHFCSRLNRATIAAPVIKRFSAPHRRHAKPVFAHDDSHAPPNGERKW